MPELPELEAISKYLTKKLSGEIITEVETYFHTVVRKPQLNEFKTLLLGSKFKKMFRKGKFLLVELEKEHLPLILYIGFGITSRFAWGDKKLHAKTVLKLVFQSESSLIFHDRRLQGSIWLFSDKEIEKMPSAIMNRKFGPDVLSISLNEFKSRIKKFKGEIKEVLTKKELVSGIGNAYADEILFEAKIHPFTNITHLDSKEIEKLFLTCKNLFDHAEFKITNWLNTTDKLDNQRFWRKELFKVHLKGGESCQKCGKVISSIKANRKVTNFCRFCQKPRNKNFI